MIFRHDRAREGGEGLNFGSLDSAKTCRPERTLQACTCLVTCRRCQCVLGSPVVARAGQQFYGDNKESGRGARIRPGLPGVVPESRANILRSHLARFESVAVALVLDAKRTAAGRAGLPEAGLVRCLPH